MLKKLLALSMVFAFGFGLAACEDLPNEGLTDIQKLDEAVADLSISTEVSEDIDLPDTSLHGITVTWESANTDLIANDGTVTQPSFTDGDEDVLLTATLMLGGVEYTKNFTVTVLATTELNDQEKLNAAVAALAIPTAVGADMTLPMEGLHEVAVAWSSSNEMYITNDGTVMQPAKEDGDMMVTLTATFTIGDLSFTKLFPVTVTASAEFSDEAKVAAAKQEILVPSTVSSNIMLRTEASNGVTVEWFSYLVEYLGNDGTVTNPLFTTGDVVVTLIAKFTSGDYEETVNYFVTVTAATEMNDEETADDALAVLLLTVSGNVEANFDLAEKAKGFDITWSSGDETLVVINGLTAEVTRPAAGEGNQEVVLTASITVGEFTQTKDFTITIKEREPALTYASIAELQAASTLGDVIEFTGIVVGVFDGGYFLSDGTHSLGIYAGNNNLNPAIGDEVKVIGSYAVYNTLYQLGSLQVEEILSSGNANPLVGTEMVKTVGEMLALDTSDKLMHGMYYTVTGTVEVRGDYGNLFLVDGNDAILIYYYSLEDSLAAIEAELGKVITITVFYYTNHGTNGPMLAYDGGAAGITVVVLNDADSMAADKSYAEGIIPGVAVADIMLPAVGPNGTTFTWVSDDHAIFGDDGVFVALGAGTSVVTFTGTAVKGALTETVTVEVVVPVSSTVAEVNAMTVGDYFEVTGVVYEESYYGFFIHADGSYIFVFNSDLTDEVEPGDEITIVGSLGEYSGLLQVNVLDYTIGTSGNALVDPVVKTVEAAENDLFARGTIATVTGTVSIEGTYDDVFLNGVAGGKIKVYYRSNADELEGFVGQVITVDIITYQNGTVLYNGVAADAVVGAVFTDADKAQAAWDALDLGDIDNVMDNITLPLENTGAGATIAWATTDALVVAADGTVTATAGMDTTATLTATITVGAEVLTKDFVITVIDENLHSPMTVTEASALADGTVVLVKGVVIGKYYDERVIQGMDGAAIWVDSDVEGNIGDEIVVMGTLSTYTSYGNNHRQLDSATYVETLSYGNDLVMSTETDVPTIFGELGTMQVYTAELTVTVLDDGFGYVLFNTVDVDYGVDGIKAEQGFKFKAADFLPTFATDYLVGDVVELTFTAFDFSFNNIRMVNVSLADTPEPAPMPGLFFSQYGDGDGGSCKFVELYNPTDATIDLTEYKIIKGGNGTAFGASSDIEMLTGTLAAGEVLVVGNPACFDGSDAGSVAASFPMSVPHIDSTVVGYINGDDALGLFHNDVLIDTIGLSGVDPGSSWPVGNGNLTDGTTANVGLIRISSVMMGEADWAVAAMQWIVIDDRDYTDVGIHTIDMPATLGLFFSQYGDGDGGSCKFVELYNPTAATIDLSEYKIIKGGNGTAFDASSDIEILTGTLAAGEVLVVGNPACFDGSDAGSVAASFPMSVPHVDSTVVGYINGDDALGLFHNDVLIDVIGLNGVDPGSSWPVGNGNLTDGTTANVGLIRISSVTMGEADWAVAAMQWIVIDDRDYTDVGIHTID